MFTDYDENTNLEEMLQEAYLEGFTNAAMRFLHEKEEESYHRGYNNSKRKNTSKNDKITEAKRLLKKKHNGFGESGEGYMRYKRYREGDNYIILDTKTKKKRIMNDNDFVDFFDKYYGKNFGNRGEADLI